MLAVSVAAVVGLFIWRRLDLLHRMLVLQLWTWMVLYTAGWLVLFVQDHYGLKRNNVMVYNVQVLSETSLLVWALKKGDFEFNRLQILIPYIIFIVTFVAEIISVHFTGFVQLSYVLECIFMTMLLTLFMYRGYHQFGVQWTREPMFWSCLGLLVYFACSLPYFALFDYLNANYLHMSESLHKAIIDVVSNFRYLTLLIALLMLMRQNTQKITDAISE